MHLLYLDESGDLARADDQVVVVAGLAVFEGDVRELCRQVDDIVDASLDPHLRHLEIHAQHIRKGKGAWRGIPKPLRSSLLQDLADLLADFGRSRPFGLFGVARDPSAVPSAEPIERMFEELLMRFDSYIRRTPVDAARQSGIVVVDEAKYAKLVQPMAMDWRVGGGARSGRLTRLVEVPLFVPSDVSRLVQLADLVAHAIYLAYRDGETDLFDRLKPGFQRRTQGQLDGLVHLTPMHRTCPCWTCNERRRE